MIRLDGLVVTAVFVLVGVLFCEYFLVPWAYRKRHFSLANLRRLCRDGFRIRRGLVERDPAKICLDLVFHNQLWESMTATQASVGISAAWLFENTKAGPDLFFWFVLAHAMLTVSVLAFTVPSEERWISVFKQQIRRESV